jgi:hypothetical protein
MSEASESAHVRIVLADYVVADQQGKVTLVGAGLSIFSVNLETEATSPFGVWASVTFPPDFVGYSPTIELLLEAEDGTVVQLPNISGDQKQSRALRVATYEPLPPTVLPPGIHIPPRVARSKAQILLQFQAGLKLDTGQLYRWRVTVDGFSRDDWTEMMYIPTASARPSFG